jgi:hypothetical protein
MDSQGNKIALFLGSGASVTFNKPTTQQLRDTLLTIEKFEDIEHVFQALKSAL